MSLLRHEALPVLGVSHQRSKVEQWAHVHTILTRGGGDTEDHATLLCGLLLGLGVEAYVCVGTKAIKAPGGARQEVRCRRTPRPRNAYLVVTLD